MRTSDDVIALEGLVKSGLDIKTGPSRGGTGVHGVRFEDVVVGNAQAISGYHSGSGISISATYKAADKGCEDRGPFPAIIDNVSFVNIVQVAGAQCSTAITLAGSPLHNITRLALVHVHLNATSVAGQFDCKNVQGSFRDVDGTKIGVQCPGLQPVEETLAAAAAPPPAVGNSVEQEQEQEQGQERQSYIPGKKMVMIWSSVSSNATANDEYTAYLKKNSDAISAISPTIWHLASDGVSLTADDKTMAGAAKMKKVAGVKVIPTVFDNESYNQGTLKPRLEKLFANPSKFIAAIVNASLHYNFDGVNLDLEPRWKATENDVRFSTMYSTTRTYS